MCYLPSKSGILSAAPVTIWPTLTIGDSFRISPSPRESTWYSWHFLYKHLWYSVHKTNLHTIPKFAQPLQFKFGHKWEIELVSHTPAFTKQMQYFSISELLCKNTLVFTEISKELFYLLEYLLYYIFTLNL